MHWEGVRALKSSLNLDSQELLPRQTAPVCTRVCVKSVGMCVYVRTRADTKASGELNHNSKADNAKVKLGLCGGARVRVS